jgi:hypothetical protein
LSRASTAGRGPPSRGRTSSTKCRRVVLSNKWISNLLTLVTAFSDGMKIPSDKMLPTFEDPIFMKCIFVATSFSLRVVTIKSQSITRKCGSNYILTQITSRFLSFKLHIPSAR